MQKDNFKHEKNTDANNVLCEVLSIQQKRELASEQFEKHNYAYRNICWAEKMGSNFKGGYFIFSGSRNFDDVYVVFNELNDRQKELIREWGFYQYLT